MGNGEWGMGNGIAPKIFVHKNFRRDWGMGNGEWQKNGESFRAIKIKGDRSKESQRERGKEFLAFFYSQFPIPNSQFPIPNSQFPIPNSQFPIPNSQFPNIKE
jgi:hypothetical protein